MSKVTAVEYKEAHDSIDKEVNLEGDDSPLSEIEKERLNERLGTIYKDLASRGVHLYTNKNKPTTFFQKLFQKVSDWFFNHAAQETSKN